MEDHADRADAEEQPDIRFNSRHHILCKAVKCVLPHGSGIDQKTGSCLPANRIGFRTEKAESIKDVSVHIDPSGA